MRGKKLAWNTTISLLQQIVTVICGFILPRLILMTYGSSVNGLINSITQFVGVISFLELGVGAVVQSALYKPLSDNDSDAISRIMSSGNKFFRNLALILLGYIAILEIVYPIAIVKDFGFAFTATLIASMSISWFSEYYFGIVNGLLLKADQKAYVLYITQSLTLIMNTVACYFLIDNGASIQLVKLATSIIYLLRPLVLFIYVNKHYNIDRKIKYDVEPIQQKWNGIAQHVAGVVLVGTDTIVLTIFSTLESVSVYAVYSLVVSGLRQLFLSITNPIQALMGAIWVSDDKPRIQKVFLFMEWGLHEIVTFVFGCTLVLIMPFVKVYTNGVNDANYNAPLFAFLITIASICFSLRMPYFDIMVKACNHYKQTQMNSVISALINIISSVLLVNFLGINGVAIGTILAMAYQMIWMANYTYKNLVDLSLSHFFKQIIFDFAVFGIGFFATKWISLGSFSYFSWIIMALKVAGIWSLVVVITNIIVYKDNSMRVIRRIIRRR